MYGCGTTDWVIDRMMKVEEKLRKCWIGWDRLDFEERDEIIMAVIAAEDESN